ncbi:MAG: hypothetical protein HOC79_05670 [Euryarchaeota archaeon]|jgi:hypothetical protein|nr:hypothetical protein [Euryarchaeota archaeon]
MGTLSLTVFTEHDSKTEIVVMYRQFDGYIEGHGDELAKFLQLFTMTNGISPTEKKSANGMGCLSAQVISHFKQTIKTYDWDAERVFNVKTGAMELPVIDNNHSGGFYLYPAGSRDCGEEYIYYISQTKGGIYLRACVAGSPERTWENKIFPAKEEEDIWEGFIDNWNLGDALAMEKHIMDRKHEEWKAKQELEQ